ncbi:hypothetical protein HPB47_016382 [Ixodes persulcatus]|uniref:Uncharacterized protein n=1 Tax=Ixodes persulcatus TaxID=34615 RepID=A0AC60QR83_IXOPE|nr:hypothetical protein HPB47_016382 [Ixodes persulcatus]
MLNRCLFFTQFLACLADSVLDNASGRHFHATSVIPAPSAPSQYVIDPACMRTDCTIFKVDDSHGGSSDFMLPGIPQVILFGDITLDRPIFDRASTVTRGWLHYFSTGRGAVGAEMRSD